MIKKIDIPENLDFGHDSRIWNLLQSRAFSKLRCGGADDLNTDELEFLRKEFEQFCCLTDGGDDHFSVEEAEPLTVAMMEKAAFEITKLEMKH